MRYLVVALLEDLTTERRGLLQRVSVHKGDILCPDVDGAGASYIYLKESGLPSLLTKVKGVIPCMSLDQYITSDEAFGFLSRLSESDRIRVGDLVKVSGYGDMVFTVEDQEDAGYLVKADIRNKEVLLPGLRKTQLRIHKEASYFVYTDVQSDVDGFFVVDVDYLKGCDCVDFSSYTSLINFFLRLKLQLRKKLLCFSFNSEVPPKLFELLEIFGLSYSFKHLAQGALLLSDRLYHMMNYPMGVLHYDKDTCQFVLSDSGRSVLPVNRTSFIGFYSYLRDHGLCREVFSESDMLRRSQFEDWGSLVKEWISLCPELNEFFLLQMSLVQPKLFPFELARVGDFIEMHKMVWFKENIDYYTNVIRG